MYIMPPKYADGGLYLVELNNECAGYEQLRDCYSKANELHSGS